MASAICCAEPGAGAATGAAVVMGTAAGVAGAGSGFATGSCSLSRTSVRTGPGKNCCRIMYSCTAWNRSYCDGVSAMLIVIVWTVSVVACPVPLTCVEAARGAVAARAGQSVVTLVAAAAASTVDPATKMVSRDGLRFRIRRCLEAAVPLESGR